MKSKTKSQTFRFLLTVILMLLCSGCKAEVSRKAVDVSYQPAYTGVETVYEYQYDYMNDSWVYVPRIETVFYPEEYYIGYEVTYDDGSTRVIYETTTYSEYERTKDALCNLPPGAPTK